MSYDKIMLAIILLSYGPTSEKPISLICHIFFVKFKCEYVSTGIENYSLQQQLSLIKMFRSAHFSLFHQNQPIRLHVYMEGSQVIISK